LAEELDPAGKPHPKLPELERQIHPGVHGIKEDKCPKDQRHKTYGDGISKGLGFE
jgi:hypothetical protein